MPKRKAETIMIKRAKRQGGQSNLVTSIDASVNSGTDFKLNINRGSNASNWPIELVENLRKFGVVNFVNSDIEESSPDLREWLQSHYLSLDVDSKVFVGGAKDGVERLQLREKKLVNIKTEYYEKTIDKRLKKCWSWMEVHARQCLSVFTSNEKLKFIDNISAEELVSSCKNSRQNVLSVFSYDSKPAGSIICPDHVDRGFITCTTNQDGGLEVYVNSRWLTIPPTKGLICFAGYALHKMSDGVVPMVRHRVVSTSPQKKRISVAFKLRPSVLGPCNSLNKIMDKFDVEYRSVNQPAYQDREALPAVSDWALVGNSTLRTSAYLKHCVRNGLPWQQKPNELLWSEFCKSWNEKVRVWGQKRFKIWDKEPRGAYLYHTVHTAHTWSDLMNEGVYPYDIYVCSSNPVDSSDYKSESLGPIIELFTDFVPRWGEVFEMYAIQNTAITTNPEFIFYKLRLRGD